MPHPSWREHGVDDVDHLVQLIDVEDGHTCNGLVLVDQRDLVAIHLRLKHAAAKHPKRVRTSVIGDHPGDGS